MTQNDKDFVEKIRAGKITPGNTADFITAQFGVIELLEKQVAMERASRLPNRLPHPMDAMVQLTEGGLS